MAVTVVLTPMAVIVAIISRPVRIGIGYPLDAWRRRLRHLRLRRGSGVVCRAALDDLVELTAIEPDAPALGTIIDLDALTVAHHERDLADRTGHSNGGIRHTGSTEVVPRRR